MAIDFHYEDTTSGVDKTHAYGRLYAPDVINGLNAVLSVDIYWSAAAREANIGGYIKRKQFVIPALIDEEVNPDYTTLLSGDVLAKAYDLLMLMPFFIDAELA